MFEDSHKQQDTIANRRGFLAQATEFVSAVPLVGYAATNWNKQDQYNVLNLADARMAERPLQERSTVKELFAAQNGFHRSASALYSAYKQSYHKSRIVMVPSSNGKTTTLRPQTQYYWAVPSGLPRPQTVSSWISCENKMAGNISALTQASLVDIDKLKEVAIESKKGNDKARQALTALVYGSSVAMLWGYEEAVAYARSKSNGTTYHHERYEKTTATQETRRGFIKVGAALLGAGVAAGIHMNIQDRLGRGEERLANEISDAEATANQDVDHSIAKHFGETLDATYSRIVSERQTAEGALLSGQADAIVSQALRSFVQAANNYAEKLVEISGAKAEKEALAYLSKCKLVTAQLESAGTSDERIATSAAILEGLGIAGAMSLVIIPGSILNGKFPVQKDIYPELDDFKKVRN